MCVCVQRETFVYLVFVQKGRDDLDKIREEFTVTNTGICVQMVVV